MRQHVTAGAAILTLGWPVLAEAQTCPAVLTTPAPTALAAEISRLNADMDSARIAGDVDRLMRHFASDSLIMPENQPRLSGPGQGAAYYRTLASRLRVAEYSGTTVDILPLDDGALEWGTFEIAYAPVTDDRLERRQGKYAHLWRRKADGTLELKAELWGFLAPLGPSAAHWMVNIPGTVPRPAPVDADLAAELDRINAGIGDAVRSHNPSRIDLYASDAVYLPYADRPQVGIEAIRAHLLPYIENGRGASFESVRLSNDGFDRIGGYVVEYPSFEVHWRAGDASGVTAGNGLRLWRRESDCTLKLVHEASTHHRP